MRCGSPRELVEVRPSQWVMNLKGGEGLVVEMVEWRRGSRGRLRRERGKGDEGWRDGGWGRGGSQDVLGFDHAAGFVLAAAALAENGVNFVDEDDAGLEFAGETEDGVDELVGVAVPFLRQGRDVEVDEAGAAFMGEGFGEHGLATTRRTVQKDTRGCGEEG